MSMDPEIIEAVRGVFTLWPAGATAERIEGYAMLLQEDGLRGEDAAAGCKEVSGWWEGEFAPPVAKLLFASRHHRMQRLKRTNARALPPVNDADLTTAMRAELHLSRYIRHKQHRHPSPGEVEAWLARRGVSEVLQLKIPEWDPETERARAVADGVREAIRRDPKHEAGMAAVRRVRRGQGR